MVKISIHVDDKVWIAFKSYVLAKYGGLWKYLGEEVSRALEEYMRHSPAAHTYNNVQQKFSTTKRHIALLIYIIDFDEITKQDIEEYVMRNFGIDKRTRNKYLQFLLKNRFITLLKPAYSNVIYKVERLQILKFLKQNLDEKSYKFISAKIKAVEGKKELTRQVETTQVTKSEIVAYAGERYFAGDSVSEIKEKLEDFGEFNKKQVKKLLRKAIGGMKP